MSEQITKYCPDCDDERDESEFYYNSGNSDDLSTYCKGHSKERIKNAQKQRRALRRSLGLTIEGVAPIAVRLAREETSRLEATFERVEREPNSSERGMYFSSSSKPLNQIVSQIVFGPSPIKFKRAWTT